ncbi:MAG: tRNA glutamyl-Q(34) synthetase GluQRS [Pseudomonadota bacterium]
MTEPQSVFRFAPSPNGELHLGHAYSALLNLKIARASDGKMLLRIEDIDTVRCTPQLEKQMFEDLEWIGFEWDELPRRQSEHFDDYREALFQLEQMELIYASSMSRSEIKQRVAELEVSGTPWPRDPDGTLLYPGTERQQSQSARKPLNETFGHHVIRLDMAKTVEQQRGNLSWEETIGVSPNNTRSIPADPLVWGDVILARRDTPTSYHLSCIVDDAKQNITHIVRGQDLYHSTSVHRLLQELLGLSAPLYHHHELVLDKTGKKLSKSDRDTSLRQLRQSGTSKEQILKMIGFE